MDLKLLSIWGQGGGTNGICALSKYEKKISKTPRLLQRWEYLPKSLFPSFFCLEGHKIYGLVNVVWAQCRLYNSSI